MNKIFKELTVLLITGIILISLDYIYILFNRQSLELQVVSIQRVAMSVNMTGVFLCYLLLTFGVYYFVVREHKSTTDAFLMGVFVYGVYEATNYSVFKKWKEELAIMDTIWGGALFALTNSLVKVTRGLLQL
jgi:uncharacterized membrane protein